MVTFRTGERGPRESWSPWTLPGLVNRALERQKALKSLPASLLPRGLGGCMYMANWVTGSWGAHGQAGTCFCPGLLGAGVPLKPGMFSPPRSKAESTLTTPSIFSFPNLAPSSAPVGSQKVVPLGILGSGFQKEAGSKAFLWQGTHLGQGSTDRVGGVRCAHRQEVPRVSYPSGGAGWGRDGEGRRGWPPGF